MSRPPLTMLKLGKRPAVEDVRTLALTSVLAPTFQPPAAYDADAKLPGIHNPMFANDRLGDCVIAGRAHQTRRFEAYETGKAPTITDAEVTNEYFAETGGQDTGLYLMASLSVWRKRGWVAGGKRLRILAYGSVNPADPAAVKAAMAMDYGAGIGLQLPVDAEREFDGGKPWTIRRKTGTGAPGSWGGHYVYGVAYDAQWLTVVTWGQRQRMSWDFLAFYSDEVYGILDARDVAAGRVDGAALGAYLADKAPLAA